MKTTAKLATATAALWLLTALPAGAQEISQQQYDSLVTAIDTVWVAVCAALVLLMHLGFGLVESGLTRAKNAANIVGKNMMTVAVGGAAYWAVGAALAYGNDAGGFIGTNGFFAPATLFPGGGLGGTGALFQLVFAATAATIVSGAVAERIKFTSYILVALMLTAVIYPVVSHWQWGGGWLFGRGFYDFAGSTMVHLVGGSAALAGVMILGPRLGKYGKDGKPRAIPGHNIPFALFGVLVLFFGWFGFNGGSTLHAFGAAETIGTVLLNTTIAGSFGALAAGVVNTLISKKPDPAMMGNGALAGLVGITAGPDLATNWWAVIIGIVCGAVVVLAVLAIDRLHLDDPVGAISVHGVCGALGTLFVGIHSSGVANGSDTGVISFGTQLVGVVAVAGFAFVASAAVFLAVRAVMGLRVSETEELEGLDMHEHGVPGYPDLLLGPTGGHGTLAGQTGPFAPAPTGRAAPTG